MIRWLVIILCVMSTIASVSWLAGYGRAVWPFVADGVRDRDFDFLTYPHIKWFTEVDEQTGKMSEMKIDWFSVSDGPTGIVYTHRYFPCWIVSLVAIVVLGATVACSYIMRPKLEKGRSMTEQPDQIA
jgi:disulfide bond formation protein DsbB